MTRMRAVIALVVIMLLTAVAGCTSSGFADKAGNAPSPTPTPVRYGSTAFVVPLEVTAPSWLGPAQLTDATQILTWEPTGDQPAVRFVVPLNVYHPGRRTPSPVPENYLGYLLGLTKYGARFTDQAQVDVDGHPATLLTLTADAHHNGALGCTRHHQPASDCFGLQVQLSLRIAVLTVDGHDLVIWLRQTGYTEPADATARVDLFEEMLRGIHFVGGAPPSSSATR